MSGKELLIFANEFPYSNYETYMETEMQYWNKFDDVYIFSLQLRKKNKANRRKVPNNCHVMPVLFNPIAYIVWTFRALLDRNLYKELYMLFNEKKLSLRSFTQLFVYVSRSHYEAYVIVKNLRKSRISFQSPVYYSYRFGYQPYVALLVREKIGIDAPMYCRAHRYDLYENRKKTNYIPMRRYILSEITKCFPVSDDGTEYLKKCYPSFIEKIETRYLGTVDFGRRTIKREDEFRIVSCSSVSKVKRLDLIIDALGQLSNETKITWVHFGDGPLMDEMKSRVNEKLHENIRVMWRGNKNNKDILMEYASGVYNLFINSSSSEGIPVSIMEAISAGIPVIATDVGGTREIIKDGVNGSLLPENVSAEQITRTILRYKNMDEETYQSISDNARSVWESSFNSDINYKRFVNEII